MFTNLIESESHRKEFKRRSSFFLATVAAYALMLFVGGVASIYAYDARLEAQNSELTLLNWVPHVTEAAPRAPRETQPRQIRRTAPSNARVDRTATVQERTVAQTNDPTKPPDQIGVTALPAPTVTDVYRLSNRNVDPSSAGPGNSSGCITCTGTTPLVRVEETTPPPAPTPIKPKTQTVTSNVLIAKVISLPTPGYPPMAKQIRADGPVAVQILVDEQGKVISAQPVSGHPLLVLAAREAALRARFTATVLNGQPVKIQGVITYNFVLQ
jgi:TonB family protein